MMKRQEGPTAHLQDVFVRDRDFPSNDENSLQLPVDKTDCDRHNRRSFKKRQEEPKSHLQDVFLLDMDKYTEEHFLANSSQSHLDKTDCDPQHGDESVMDKVRKPANCCSGELCMDFTQSTTLHGLRYVWLPGATTLRRVIWFLLVAGCVTVSSYQILDRIVHFYSLPVNVNVKVNFNDTMIFPTITICNQNSFRATRAEELGHYNLLTEMYKDLKSFKSSRLGSYNATNLTLNDLFADIAHTKMDMIIGCTWQGKPCGPENFTERMTDHGMCYSFNHPENDTVDIKKILAPGENRGLTLTLNAERYEYMSGQHHAVGIEVLIHDHKQFPKVTDLGMSLPIGKHSFVAMKLIEANNLPKPHGDCSSPKLDYFENYSQESCEIECVTKELEEKCGCRLHYMPCNKDSPGVCTLSQYLDCYLTMPVIFVRSTSTRRNAVRLRQDIHNRCYCPEPCHFKIFEPSVSYASFSSSFNQSKFIQTRNKTNLEMTYQRAREISGRQQNERIPLNEALTDLENNIEKCVNDTQLLLDATVSTYNAVHSNVDELMLKHSLARMFYWKCKNRFKDIISRGWNPVDKGTFSSIEHDTGDYLFTIETRLKQLVDPQYSDPSSRKMLYFLTGSMLEARLDIAKRMKHSITQILTNTTMFFSNFVDSSLDLNETMHLVTYFESISYPFRYQLNSLIMDAIGNWTYWISSYQDMLEEAFIENKLNMTTMNHLRDKYHTSLNRVLLDGDEIFDKVFRLPLDFLIDTDKSLRELDDVFWKYQYRLDENLRKMNASLIFIQENLSPFREKIFACRQYLSGKMDKLKVAKMYFNQRSDEQISLMNYDFDVFKMSINDHEGIVDDVVASYSKLTMGISFDIYRSVYLSAFNQTDLLSFPLVEEVRDMYMVDNGSDTHRPLVNTRESLLQAIEVLTELMEEYVETSEVDVKFLRNNLLQVDFFYREMSYESITQQVGYDLFALLCDIGGSMGLFIGASVVTVFEVLDLIVNLAIKNFRRKKKTN